MATRDVFSEVELAGLRGFPPVIGRDELIRHFTLSEADAAFVRRFRGSGNVLGAAVQLCTLPWLGFVPDDVACAPGEAVSRLAGQLGVPCDGLAGYGLRGQTRTDHLREVAAFLGWRSLGPGEAGEFDEFLLARALEHDSPKLLFGLGCEYLVSARVIRPGVVLVLERVASARDRARAETWARVEHLLPEKRREQLDAMLVVDPVVGRSRLSWLGEGPTQANPAAVKAELAKLAFLRSLGADQLDLSMLPGQRLRFLAGLGRRLTAQALTRREPARRYPILLAVLSAAAVDVLDESVLLFDQAVSGRESAARSRMTEALAQRGRGGEDRQVLLDEILAVVLDPQIADEQVGGLLRERIGLPRLRDAAAAGLERLPRDHGHLALLDSSIGYLRQFAPDVLGSVRFAGGPGSGELLAAVTVLASLYATGARKVPPDAPTGFVPARWAGYLADAGAAGDATGFRHYWELCVLLGLRDGLRSGDVFVPGSRRYADPASFLLTTGAWEPLREEYAALVGRPVTGVAAVAAADEQLHAALGDLEGVLAGGGSIGGVRLDDQGRLVVPPAVAPDVPERVTVLRDDMTALLPRAPLPSVLVELDSRTGYLDRLVHAGGRATRPPELKRNLIYVITAAATNMGLTAMADSCGVPYDVLAWTAEWYLRQETLEAANAAIVDYHHRLPLAGAFGSGTLSSSDGQRFPSRGRSITARAMSRYFARGQGISTYTHVSDQHSTYATRVIVATAPEGHYVLDGILGNDCDLPITEHATDTHGASLANFALFDLVGMTLSPRIRDLGGITLHRTGPRAQFHDRYPHAGPLLSRRCNTELITTMWDDLLRVAASVKYGHATAALVVGRLCSSKRQQNTLTAAIKEYGALRRTIYAARYLSDDDYRHRITRQLNKGENLHSLRRDLAYAGEGAVRRRPYEAQNEQMLCLTLATNAVVTWTTEYYALATTALRNAGRTIEDTDLAHIWPSHNENVNFYGTHKIDIAGELAKLDTNGYRPLRPLRPQ